jgi:hypothetical protein
VTDETGLGARRSALGLLTDRLRAVRIRWHVIALSVALVGSTVLLAFGSHWWMPGMLLVAIAGASLWSLADRALMHLRESASPREAVELVYVSMRWIAALIGLLALAAFLLSAGHIILGGGWN